MDFMPFGDDPDKVKKLQAKMRDWMVETTIRNDPEVRDAVGKVIQRRREGVPSGAKGNR